MFSPKMEPRSPARPGSPDPAALTSMSDLTRRILLPLLACLAVASFPPARAEPGADERISERFNGGAGRGPYYLSWRGFTPGTDRVTLNGVRLYRAQDYWVDPAAGTFALNTSVSPGDEIVVEYRRGGAQANAPTSLSPSVQLLDTGSTRLQAIYSFTQPAGAGGAPLRVSTVGLGANTAGKNWKVDSSLLLATQGGGFNERSGMRIGGQYGFGALQLTGGYSRSGSALDPKGVEGLQKSLQTTSLGLLFKPSDRFRFSTQYQTTSGTDKKGDGKTSSSQELALKPTDRTSLLASHLTEEVKSGDTTTKTRTDTLRLEQQLTGGTSALAELQTVSSGQGDTGTARVGLSTKLTPGISLETTAFRKQTDPGDDTEKKVESGLQAKIVTSAGPVNVQTHLEQKQQDKTDQSVAGLEIASRGGTVKLQGEVGHNSDPDAEGQSLKASVQLQPFKPLKLTAGLNQSEQSSKSGEDSTDPVRSADTQVGVEVQPNAAVRFAAQLQTSSATAGDTNVTSLSTQLKPFNFLQLSGTLKQRDAPEEGIAGADTRIAQVALNPVRGWKLTGGYTQNPEENGSILQAIRRRLGMETRIGALLLNGGYEFEDRTGGAGLRTTELGFGLRFSPTTQLQASYKIVDGHGEGFGDSSIYGLKFNRNLGDTFSLSLEGEAAAKRDDPSADNQKQYTGTAKLGMKF